jgi:hypothetical protein
MGGQTYGMLLWVSFLLFPHLLVVVGGCGWVEHKDQEICERVRHAVGS